MRQAFTIHSEALDEIGCLYRLVPILLSNRAGKNLLEPPNKGDALPHVQCRIQISVCGRRCRGVRLRQEAAARKRMEQQLQARAAAKPVLPRGRAVARRHQTCHFRKDVRLLRLRKDLRTGSISRDGVNFSSELCRRRSGCSLKSHVWCRPSCSQTLSDRVRAATWGRRRLYIII